MKIIFICGSLESGHDGVGDYTRRLAGALLMVGHKVSVIAINDPFLKIASDENQSADGVFLSVSRLPAMLGDKERFRLAESKIKAFGPDWISLQFVPFSFHPKGLPFKLSSRMKTLISGYRFHIMFHELWVGINSKVKLKMLLLGLAQKILIKRLLRQLNPDLITTSTLTYKEALYPVSVQILPLFSNVPVTPQTNCAALTNEYFKVVHFGSFSGAIDEFKLQLQFLVEAASFSGKETRFFIFGDGGPFKKTAITAAKEILGENNIRDLGRISFFDISCVLQAADVGISRANYALSGKSGSTLAMIEHGLPVLLRGEQPDGYIAQDSSNDQQLFFCNSKFQDLLKKWPSKSGVKESAKMFVDLLNEEVI